jgi:hypothetical protein
MKNLTDLFILILSIETANENKMVTYHVAIDCFYHWVTLYEKINLEAETPSKTLFQHMRFETESELQQVYWTLFNSARHGLKK